MKSGIVYNLRRKYPYAIIKVNVKKRGIMVLLNLIFVSTILTPLIFILIGINRNTLPERNFKIAAIANIKLIAITMFLLDIFWNISMRGEIEKDFKESVDYVIDTISANDMEQISGISINDMSLFLNESIEFFLLVLPATIIVWTVVISFIEYKICHKIYTRKDENTNLQNITDLKDYTLNREFATAMMIIFVVSLIMNFTIEDLGQVIYVNVSIVFRFFLSVQGIAVVVTFFRAKKVKNSLAVTIGIIIYFVPYGGFILMLLGIGEIVLGIRKRIS